MSNHRRPRRCAIRKNHEDEFIDQMTFMRSTYDVNLQNFDVAVINWHKRRSEME